MSKPFPAEPFLEGNYAPILMEADAADLPVIGEIPKELSGTLYRNGPNPQYAPRGRYHWFTGDGMIHAFAIENGKVDYRNRWVRTPKWQQEHEAGEALYAGFGGPGADPRVAGKDSGGIANTNIVWHGGKLLALEEAHFPFALDPVTLAPEGPWNFAGMLPPGGRVTAHPKFDPETGEMIFFGYSASGPFTKTILYGVVDREGRLTRLDRFEAPYAAMVHDFIVTKNYVLFPILPLTGSMDRAKNGQPAYVWEPARGSHVGIMRRDAPVTTMRWFESDPCYVFHPMNAYEEDGKIIADVMQYETAPLFPDIEGRPGDPAKAVARLNRWVFDLAGNSNGFAHDYIDDLQAEFPRFDERRTGLAYRDGFFAFRDETVDPFASFNGLAHLDLKTNKRSEYRLPKGDAFSEPVFVPRHADAEEGDGFLLATVYRGAEKRSDLAVFDAKALTDGPLALAALSHRVPFGFHGNWRSNG